MAANSLGDLVISVASDLNPLRMGLKTIPSLLDTAFRGGVFEAGRNVAEAVLGVPKDLIAEAVQLSASWERTTTEIDVFLGSASKAQSLMVDLRKFASESPLRLSETVAEAKKLLAAGISDTQLIPTMEMLSDLSVGNQHVLHALTRAYTDVIAAGRLYGTELRQFTETGIPLIEELAKVLKKPKEEIRSLMEAGRVGTGDLQKALKSLTGEGGKFFQMTKRGSETLEGQFEKMRDAAEDFKREFGRAIIEEIGLKDVVKDSTKFADEIKRFINDLRPGIKFVGDLMKGIGQVVGELIRNGPVFAAAFGDAFKRAAPWAGKLVDDVSAAIRSLQDFKLDPEDVVAFGLHIASAIGEFLDFLLKQIGKGIDWIGEKVKPITDALQEAAQSWKDLRNMLKPLDQAKRDEWLKAEKASGVIPADVGQMSWYQRKLKDDDFKMAAAMSVMEKTSERRLTIKEAFDPSVRKELFAAQDQLKQQLIDTRTAMAAFFDTEFRAKYTRDIDDAKRALEELPVARRKVLEEAKKAADLSAKFGVKDLKAGDVDLLKALPSADQGEFGKMFEAFKDEFRKGMDGLVRKYGGVPLSASEAERAAMIRYQDQATVGMDMLAGAAFGAAKGLQKVEVSVDEFARFRTKMVELNGVIEPPSKQFADQWNDLLQMRNLSQQGVKGFEKFNDRAFNLAAADLFKKFQPQGMNKVKLPTAAEYGSSAAAELYARANSAGGATTNNLLQQMLVTETEQLAEARRQTEAFLRNQPQMIVLPPW